MTDSAQEFQAKPESLIAKILRKLSWRRLYLMVVKQEGTPESLARGVGLGFFICFAFPFGTHLTLGIPTAFLLRANKFLTILFTFVSNPYTLPFIWPAQCWIGAMLMGRHLALRTIEEEFAHLLSSPSIAAFKELGAELLWPFLLGGLVLGILFGIPSYFTALGMIQAHRKRKEKALRLRLSMASKRGKSDDARVD